MGRSYAELRGFQLRLDIAQKNINIQHDTLDLTNARQAAGLATHLDVSRAAAQLETTRSVVPSLQSGVEISIHRLSVLLGEEPGALRAELLPGAPVPLTPPFSSGPCFNRNDVPCEVSCHHWSATSWAL